MKFTFGDIVVVNDGDIGVVVKSWLGDLTKSKEEREPTHEVYVRVDNKIVIYKESEMERYMVRHKYLSEEEKQYQFNAINDN